MNTVTLTPESIVKRDEAVLYTDTGDALVLMSIESGNYFEFDQVGSDIWSLIDGEAPIAQICEKLIAEYAIDREACQADTLDFLNSLHRLDLITVD